VFWGIVCSTIAAMLLLAGGLKAVQTISFVVSFPFVLLMVAMAWALVKQLTWEH
jgi:glycine betaine transporter